MKFKKIFLSIGLFLFATISFAQSSPIVLLQSISNQMINSLKVNKTTLRQNPSLVYSLANKILVPHADLTEMSKRVLPRATWNKATILERTNFQHEFTTLLVRTYASALAEYNDQTLKFFPIRGGFAGKSDVRVESQIIRNDGPPISVNYQLAYKNNAWYVYDIIVEGVSMLESFRSQFADELSQGNITSLIKLLRNHNAINNGKS